VETLVRILIICDDKEFVNDIKKQITHPQVMVYTSSIIPEDESYNFYVLGGSLQIAEAVDKIRKSNEGSPIYLVGSMCDAKVPVRKMIKCNIVDCLENQQKINDFVKKVNSFCNQKIKMRKTSSKLDCLKAGDLESLAREMKQTESRRFVDYIQNHPLPMVLVSRECDILHANSAMEDMIGTKLPGMSAATYWVDPKKLDETICDLEKEGQLLGREVTLKNIDGEHLSMKIYTSIHTDEEGNWLNTRCLFVPTD